MFQLVVAEKPSVARDLARILGARTRRDGYLEGNGYRVSWALGHLVRYAEPAEYGGAWAGRWSLKPLPMVPDHWRLRTEKKTAKQFRVLKQLMNDSQTTGVICATDAGREGEHIFRLIYRHARCRKPVQRLWVSSLTDTAIRDGLRRLQPGGAYDPLARAAEARAKADWLVGLNLTRAYTVRHKVLCTIGRVQTPTLAMIVTRERAIREFVKSTYFEVGIDLAAGFQARLLDGKEIARIEKRDQAEAIVAKLQGQSPALVDAVETKRKKRRPPPLYDLTNLQRDANRRFGMTAAMTLKHAQALYETHKLISYPRTESHHISEDMVPGLPRILESLDHPKAQDALTRLRNGLRLSKFYVDRTKLSDHHGILPTGRRPPANLSPPLKKVFGLIVARFIGIFLPDYEEDQTKLWLSLAGERFLATGKVVVEMGWKAVDPPPKKKDEDRELPPCERGQSLDVAAVQLLEKETKPPSRFTDAALLNAMKTAGKALDDNELAQAIKEAGLGTPATRAEMIEKLIRTQLIRRQKKVLLPTEKGEALIDVVAEALRSAEMTARWEQRLKEIEDGKGDDGAFLRDIELLLNDIIPTVGEGPAMMLSEEAREASKSRYTGVGAKLDIRCPRCGQGELFAGKKAFVCSRYKEGCPFSVWKVVAGKKLSAGQLRAMIRHGVSPPINGFRAKSGKTFRARLRMDSEGKTEFDFDKPRGETRAEASGPAGASGKGQRKQSSPRPSSKPKDLGQPVSDRPCPRCGEGTVIAGHRGYGCNRFKAGCALVIPKQIFGKTIQKRSVVTLLEKGRSGWLKGFRKAEKSFDGRISVAPGGKIVVLDKDGHEYPVGEPK